MTKLTSWFFMFFMNEDQKKEFLGEIEEQRREQVVARAANYIEKSFKNLVVETEVIKYVECPDDDYWVAVSKIKNGFYIVLCGNRSDCEVVMVSRLLPVLCDHTNQGLEVLIGESVQSLNVVERKVSKDIFRLRPIEEAQYP